MSISAVDRPLHSRRAPSLLGLLSTDHKHIGLNLGVAALCFFGLGGTFALLMRIQLAQPDSKFVSDTTYNDLFTMHGSTMIYLFVTPMALALAVYLVPLQIGAPSIAGPRIALGGFWAWLCGGLMMQSGWLSVQGPGDTGWYSYVPLSNSVNSPGWGMDVWFLGIMVVTAGLIALAGCVLMTIARHRAPGMSLMRMPIFTWTALVTVFMVVAAFPVLELALGLVEVDRHGGHLLAGFAGAIDYQDLFWFFGHPVVYVMFFPYLGCAVEAMAVSSHKRWFGYKAFVLSMLAFSALSMSVWSHHMFTTGGVTNQYFAFTSTALCVPAGIEYFDAIGTMLGGSIVLRTSMLFAIFFFLQFLVGGLSGIFVGSPPLDYQVYGSYMIVAHFHYTLFAGSVFGFFAGVYHWFPKVTGAFLRERLGKLHFILLVIGTNMTFAPMFWLGNDGMPRRVATYAPSDGWGTLNLLETFGAFIIALAMLIFAANVVISLLDRRVAPADPWEGHTLEWWASSPPSRFNFDRPLPPVRSYAPLLDLRHAEEDSRKEREALEKAPA